jgi:hypothetical protein
VVLEDIGDSDLVREPVSPTLLIAIVFLILFETPLTVVSLYR